MSSLSYLMKKYGIDEKEAKNVLKASIDSFSDSYTSLDGISNASSNKSSKACKYSKVSSKRNILSRIMPWPFLFIK